MAFSYFEGTMDFVAATPAIIQTHKASGSITGGRAVCTDVANAQLVVYQAKAKDSGSQVPFGVALQTVADAKEVAILHWGVAKNLPNIDGRAHYMGDNLVISGAGYWCSSGSHAREAGRAAEIGGIIISGSTMLTAFISCMV